VVPPLLRQFRPRVLVSQHGCDTRWSDPLGGLEVTIDAQRAAHAAIHALAYETADGRWLLIGGGGYQVVQVVPRSWVHLLAEAAGRSTPPRSRPPWREYVTWAAAEKPPEVMTEGDPARFIPFDWGYDPADPLDRAILATRQATFPQHGLLPTRDRRPRDVRCPPQDQCPLAARARIWCPADMFVGDEVMLDITFAAARSGLARLALAGLLRTSQDAYVHGTVGLKRAGGPEGLVLTRVQARPLARGGDRAGLAIRWEAAVSGSEPFSVLDADLGLVPAGEHATLLTLSGTYRPPPGDVLDRAILHQVAAATIRNFLSRVAAGIASQHGPADGAPAESAAPPLCRAPERP